MLAADAELDLLAAAAALFNSDLHELADTSDIDRGEWIGLEDAFVGVLCQERPHVVAAHAERRLGEIVGAKREDHSYKKCDH